MPGVTLLKHRTWSFAFQEHGGVTKEPGAWISAVGSIYTICETALRWARCWGLMTVYFALHTPYFTPHTSHLTPPHSLPRASARQPVAHNSTRLTLPASHLSPSLQVLTASHLERRPVAPRASHLERRNKRLLWQICRFLRYPKLGAVGVDGFGAPVNDNHYRYRLQTGTSMIIIVIYIHKPKWEWLSIVLVNENDYHYPMANDN